jgi:hypothetical protein
MSKSFASGRQASSSSGCRQTRSVRVWTSSQRFLIPRALRACASSRLRAGWFQKRSSATKTLPDRAEVAAEGAPARGLDEPHGLKQQAVVAAAVALDQLARRKSHAVERRALRQGEGRGPSLLPAQPQRGHLRERPAARERVNHRRHDLLAVVDADRVHVVGLERLRERRRGVAPDEKERLGQKPPHLPRRLEDAVVLERMHARDADDGGPRFSKRAGESGRKTQVDDRRLVAAGGKGRGDVFEAERLHPEERAQAKTLVDRIRPDEENVHAV